MVPYQLLPRIKWWNFIIVIWIIKLKKFDHRHSKIFSLPILLSFFFMIFDLITICGISVLFLKKDHRIVRFHKTCIYILKEDTIYLYIVIYLFH